MSKKELIVEEHFAYLMARTKRLAKLYKGQETEDLFNEAVLLAYEYKGRYNSKHTPTTFLFNQVIRRLNNKIKRELIPSFFKKEENKIQRGRIPSFFDRENSKTERGRVFVSFLSIFSNVSQDNDIKFIDFLHNDRDCNQYEEKFKAEVLKILNDSGITKKEFLLLCKRFGLGKYLYGRTLDELAKTEKMTREGVRQKIDRIKNKLKYNSKLRELAA